MAESISRVSRKTICNIPSSSKYKIYGGRQRRNKDSQKIMAWKPEKNNKKTSQGRRNIKTSSMNKNKRKSFKPYRGQGKAK